MRFARWIAVVAALVASPLCNAAGFDCAKASMAVEHQICDSPALSALDAGLAKAYVAALITADGASKSDLRQEQRHWITFVRDVATGRRFVRRTIGSPTGRRAMRISQGCQRDFVRG